MKFMHDWVICIVLVWMFGVVDPISRFVLMPVLFRNGRTRRSGLGLVDVRSVRMLLHVAVEPACLC